MRLSCVLILMAAFVVSNPVAAQDRTLVYLFRYGSTNSAEAEAAFRDFRDMMGAKLPRLAAELGGQNLTVDPDRLARLALLPVPAADGSGLADPLDLIPDLATRRAHWNQTGALALLTGRIKQQSPSGLAVRSSFFLGDLGRDFGSETVDVELGFSDSTYDTTNDSHSVALLYALALELLPDCSRIADVYVLLSQADLRAQAVAEENDALGQPLKELVARGIDAAALNCPTQ